MCHDRPVLLWRRLILKPNDIFTISCQSWLRTIPNRCKAEFNSCFSPSSSILNCKRWKGKGEYNISWESFALIVRRPCPPAIGVVEQPGGIMLWSFPFPWKQEMQTCSLLHKYSVSTRSFFLTGFFFFLFFLQWLKIANAQEKKEDCRGAQFPWASCCTHVQEIECRNYCMQGC